MIKNQLKGSVMLLITAIIWGCAFVAQSTAMDNVGPFTFMAMRSVLGAVVLIPVILFVDIKNKHNKQYIKKVRDKKTLYTGGIICGLLLCTASLFQQFGIVTTEPGKAGFITSMYMLFVPVFSIAIGKKITAKIWFCLAAAIVGLYFLCVTGSFLISSGDILVILCAFTFAFHIMTVDKFSPITDGVRLSCIQFAVCAVVSGICMFIFENPSIDSIKNAGIPILYAGIGSSGIAYTLQIIGQKYTNPTAGSMIMSTESVFALVAQIIILQKVPTGREVFGCVLMFGAIIVSLIPSRRKNNSCNM